jgi:hypothetical protein
LLDGEWAVAGATIAAQLNTAGFSTDLAQVTKIMKELAGREIVRRVAGDPVTYEYKVDLVRLWVERSQPEVVQQRQLQY